MSKEKLKALLIIVGIFLLFAILYGVITDYQKTKCLEDGGKWIHGFFGGTYANLCLPKDT
jgi:hypothetical protein